MQASTLTVTVQSDERPMKPVNQVFRALNIKLCASSSCQVGETANDRRDWWFVESRELWKLSDAAPPPQFGHWMGAMGVFQTLFDDPTGA